MEENKNKESYDVTRNQGTGMESAAQGEEGKDQRPAGAKNKEQTNNRTDANHKEGQYDKQNDDATMHPTAKDDI